MSFFVKMYKLGYRMYSFIMSEWTDPKTRSWIINKPPILAGLIIPYWLFCTIIGPRFMQNRKPYNIQKIIHIYNISQIILNTAIVFVGYYRTRHYSFWCQPVDFGEDPKELEVSNIVWWYTASKLYDLLDTVFFVLRKNFRQVTTLHLYHHILMGGGFNFATNFLSSGMVVLPFGMNALVHMFMYTYYFLAALGPKYRKYLWWKRHLTELQIVQFTIAFCQFCYAYSINCEIPIGVCMYMIIQSIIFEILFGNFYYDAYLKPQLQRKNSRPCITNGKIANGGVKESNSKPNSRRNSKSNGSVGSRRNSKVEILKDFHDKQESRRNSKIDNIMEHINNKEFRRNSKGELNNKKTN